MSAASKYALYGGGALILGAVTWLWAARGAAIVLDYAFAGCL